MKDTGKTSTFIFHHDRCAPAKWTPRDILLIADFLRAGDVRLAGGMAARLGMQLVTSEHHVAKGGEIEEIGWANPNVDGDVAETIEDICDDTYEIHPVVRVYRGPVEYAVRFAIGNEQGDLEGHETEIFKSEAEAQAFLNSLQSEPASDQSQPS